MTSGFPWVLSSHLRSSHLYSKWFTHPALSQAPNQDLQWSSRCPISSHNVSIWLTWHVLLQLGLHDRSGNPTGHCPSLPIVRDREHGPCRLNASLKRQRPSRSRKCHCFGAMQVTGATTVAESPFFLALRNDFSSLWVLCCSCGHCPELLALDNLSAPGSAAFWQV